MAGGQASRLLSLITGLLRTNDYETVVASLSLMGVLVEREDCELFAGKHKTLLTQLIRLLCKHEIEFSFHILVLFQRILDSKHFRTLLGRGVPEVLDEALELPHFKTVLSLMAMAARVHKEIKALEKYAGSSDANL